VLKESGGKSLLDAMRDASNEGMQHFCGEIQKMIRSAVIDIETGLAFATNSGNLRLELSHFMENSGDERDAPSSDNLSVEMELEIER